ncbi:MAG TPA: hypothetical protein PK431_10305 [Chitinophagales bacterium]|nr:hypothetical protein [Chitinophagales bacterium]
MKTKKFTITIPEPCTENWNEMTPTARGKFCAHCQKDVIDFSDKTDSEIAAFVKNNKGNLCGRFVNTQLDKEFSYIEQEKKSTLKYAAALALGLLTAENAVAENNNPKTQVVDNNSNQKDSTCLKTNTINSTKKDSVNTDEFEVVITAPKMERRLISGAMVFIDTIRTQLPFSLKEPIKLKKKK